MTYLGHAYNFTAGLSPASVTCAVLYLSSGITNVTISEFQTSCHPPSPRAISSPGDLQLSLWWGFSIIGQPTELWINLTEYNTAQTYNNVTAANEWPLSNLTIGSCGRGEFPFGVAFYRGYYTCQNISSAAPLDIYALNVNNDSSLWGKGPAGCPANVEATYYDFAPTSDLANETVPCGPQCAYNDRYRLSVSFPVIGYWSQNGTFNVFGPGNYTIVAADEWGNMSFEYYLVPVPPA